MKIRIGKNIYFKLTVLRLDNEPEDFSDARNIRLIVNRKASNYQYEPELTIYNNVIDFEFPYLPGVETGDYEMHLSYDKLNEESVTGKDSYFLDFPSVFTLVDYTFKEDGKFNSTLPGIALTGIIDRLKDGKDGITPQIDPDTKHWMIGTEDTGIVAEGKDGITPHIGENGNWWIGDIDTGRPSRGKAFEYSDFTEEEIKELQAPAEAMIAQLEKTNEDVEAAEEQRKGNEQSRLEAESSRAMAEALRRNAETTRVENENSRIAGEILRTGAEQARETAEAGRKSAESAREREEDVRIASESARQTAENARSSAEQLRVTAEQERVTAEASRKTEFSKLKTESETATQNATNQGNYAKEQGDQVAGTVEEIKTAQSNLLSHLNSYAQDARRLYGMMAVRKGAPENILNLQYGGYFNLSGELVLEDSRVHLYQYVVIDTHKVYNLSITQYGAAAQLVLFDNNDKMLSLVHGSIFNEKFIFTGVAKIGISIHSNNINVDHLYAYDIADTEYAFNAALADRGNRALYISAGAKYNEKTGFYEMNGLADITESQMAGIYNACSGNPNHNKLTERYRGLPIRTNVYFRSNLGGYSYNVEIRSLFYGCSNLEVAAMCADNSNFMYIGNAISAFRMCSKLRKIIGVLLLRKVTKENINYMFKDCTSLEEVYIKALSASLSLEDSPRIFLPYLTYLVENAENKLPITITVHPEVYAKIQDESNVEWHALITAGQEKQITFITV